MSKYPPSQTLPSIYPTYPTIIRQQISQPYYYSFLDDYTSPSSYSIVSPRDQYTPLIKIYDDDEVYFSEHNPHYRHHHHHNHNHNYSYRSNHQQNSNYSKANRARNVSSQLQSKNTSIINENSLRISANQAERKTGMSEYDKQTTINRSSNTNEFLAKTQAYIRQEYRKLPNPPAKDTRAAKDERNLSKSRYRDVIPGEATRVKLQPDYDDKSDFINANYVSGYNNQEKAYIFTQGPLESTVKDFWRMVWQENIVIIVMTTNVRESNTIKCYPYWPSEAKAVLNAGLYQIQNEESERFSSFIVTKLSLRKKNHSDVRTIYHAHYIKWPDHGIPPNTSDALDFLERVNYYKRLTQTQAPILVHCSAGIGRTGTFCAIDIGIKRYLEKMNIDMPTTVMKMRSERAGSVQTEDQYVFAHLALMDYIKQHEQTTTTTDNDLPDTNDDVKVQDNRNSLVDLDDNTRKTRIKKQSKKSSDLGATSTLPTIHSLRNTNSQDALPSQRGKTLSDSYVSSIQFVTPSTTTTEYNPSIPPTATGNTNHKKVRK